MEAVYVDAVRPCTHYPVMTNHKPPCIIAFASSKGGAGKSTNCLNVAGALAAMGNSVLVVDCDISETLHRWYQDNPTAQTIKGLSVEKPPETNFGDYMRAIARNESDKDFVLFDLPGQFTKDLLWVATAAHLVVTPCKVSEPDIMQANKLYLELIEIGRDYNKTIETYSERKDTPYMTKPSEQRAASETAAPAPAAAPLAKDNVTTIKHRPKKTAAETKRVSHDFPLYLIKELRMAAAQSGKTQKFLILNALKAGGFTVHDADLEEDGRRGQ